MSRSRSILSALIAILALSLTANGAVLQVPGSFPTIQAAINAAAPGDIIEVAPGTYFESIDYLGKDIVIRSTGGKSVTFIDGGLVDACVTIANGETSAAVLDGFTIQNGRADTGGAGIRVGGADPTIKNCCIRDNHTQNGLPIQPNGSLGGGLLFIESDSLVMDCLIDSNGAGDGASFAAPVNSNAGNGGNGGGAAVVTQSHVTFQRCIFIDNHAGNGGSVPMTSPARPGCNGGSGGGLYVDGPTATVTLIDCIFENNIAGNGASSASPAPSDVAGNGGTGGGIYLSRGSITMTGGAIVGCRGGNGGNGTSASGGGVGAVSTAFGISGGFHATDVVFHRNFGGDGGMANGLRASGGGTGGVQLTNLAGSNTLTDCLFSDNHGGNGSLGNSMIDSAHGGSGAAFCQAPTTFDHCRFLENFGGNGGGPMIAADGGLRPRGAAGVIRVVNASPTFVNCLMAFNHGGNGGNASGTGIAGHAGPGCVEANFAGTVRFFNCTVTENTSGVAGFQTTTSTFGASTGGAFHVDGSPGAGVFVNSIVWDNFSAMPSMSGPPTLTPTQFTGAGGPAVTAMFSDVTGGWPGTGNINANPLFVNVAMGNFHIGAGSPCIDAGTNGAMIVPMFDFDGESRILGMTVDMGADEAPSGPMGGSGQPIVLGSSVNGGGNPSAMVKTVHAGDTVDISVTDPSGNFHGSSPLLVAQLYPDGQPPIFVDLDDVHIDPTAPFFLIYGPYPSFLGEAILGPQGIVFSYVVPAGMDAYTTRFQAFVMTPNAPNGLLVATDAHDLD